MYVLSPDAQFIADLLPVTAHHNTLLSGDRAIESHNKKLRNTYASIEKAKTRVINHESALDSINSTTHSAKHTAVTKALEKARLAETRAKTNFEKDLEGGVQLAVDLTGSGKVSVLTREDLMDEGVESFYP